MPTRRLEDARTYMMPHGVLHGRPSGSQGGLRGVCASLYTLTWSSRIRLPPVSRSNLLNLRHLEGQGPCLGVDSWYAWSALGRATCDGETERAAIGGMRNGSRISPSLTPCVIPLCTYCFVCCMVACAFLFLCVLLTSVRLCHACAVISDYRFTAYPVCCVSVFFANFAVPVRM